VSKLNTQKNMNLEYTRKKLHEWYEQNQRHLPWRETNDPYYIWISEIILQQTRIAQGLDYYLRFIQQFPTIEALANAHEEEVLRLWQGLGYYSRARNLHTAAKQVMQEHNGTFPTQYQQVRQLKGIGDYTAAAICSIAYNQPYATVDGNVYRVLARLTNNATPIDSTTGKKLFNQMANTLLDETKPGIHNQALMELGATQCTPKTPNCTTCPLMQVCKALKADTIEQLPHKEKKTKITQRHFHYLYIETPQEVFLQKRTEKDIWQHLYQPPLIEHNKLMNTEQLLQHPTCKELTQNTGKVEVMGEAYTKHILSHQHIHAKMLHIRIEHTNNHLKTYKNIPKQEENNYPVPRLIEILKDILNI